MNETLKPCPFCGAGETDIKENLLNRMPDMSGKPSPVISVEVRHWCAKAPGLLRQHITLAGRERADAIAAWNRRAGDAP